MIDADSQSRSHVSAIVIAYRSSADLEALLPSLVDRVFEVIVVDNSGDDSTRKVLDRAGAGVHVIRPGRNVGFAAGINLGVERSTGTHILILNPDVRLAPGTVEALSRASETRPRAILGPALRFPDGRVQPSRTGMPSLWSIVGEQVIVPHSSVVGSWPARLWPRWRLETREGSGGPLSGCCLLFPRAVWDEVGRFDERYFLYFEEYDWQLRAHACGIESWLVPDAVVEHITAASSGPLDPWRAQTFAFSERLFVLRWTGGWKSRLSLAILVFGQLMRLAAWHLPPLAARSVASERRTFHKAMLRGLRGDRVEPQGDRIRKT